MPGRAGHRLRRVEQGHRRDHASHQRQVGPEATEPQAPREDAVADEVGPGLPGMGDKRVPDPVDGQQRGVGEQPLVPQRQGPEKVDTLQVSEEQRRVADRQQQPAAVADHEDEEHQRVGDVPPLAVGLEQRPHEEHCRAGRADEAREQGAHCQEGCVGGGRGLQVALDPHATGDHVEGEQQRDEGDVFREQRIGKHRAHGGPRQPGRRLDHRVRRKVEVDGLPVEGEVIPQRDRGQQAGHEEFAGVVLPPVGDARRERQDGDCREQQGEGNHGGRRRRGGAAVARIGRLAVLIFVVGRVVRVPGGVGRL